MVTSFFFFADQVAIWPRSATGGQDFCVHGVDSGVLQNAIQRLGLVSRAIEI